MSRVAPAIAALVVHARQVPAVERDAFGTRIREELGDRALVLETCHRVEAYWAGPSAELSPAGRSWLPAGGQALTGVAAARHAVAVAVGRDSVVVGEDQILHQVRASVDAARRAAGFDPAVDRLFSLALQAGRRARSWRQGPSRSLADVAVAAIERRAGPLAGRQLLVVGAGRMARLALGAGAAAGASIVVANRTSSRGDDLARATGAGTVPFDPGADVARFAGVVVALGGPWPVGPAALGALVRAGTIVVDLSVPSALGPAAVEELGEGLISADALARTEAASIEPAAAWLERLDRLIDETTRQFNAWLDGRISRATAEALIEQADREREAELARLWRHLPDLPPEDRAAIDGMTRHLARRLLRAPLERLGRDHDGRDEQAVRDLFAL